jgi:predicted amidohydrolase
LTQTGVSPLPDKNLHTARKMLESAEAERVDLVAFPEMFMARPENGIALTAVDETVDGPFVTTLSLPYTRRYLS